jgi:hypothetical protein
MESDIKNALPGSIFSRRFPISRTLALVTGTALGRSENIHPLCAPTEFNKSLQNRDKKCKSIHTLPIIKFKQTEYSKEINP